MADTFSLNLKVRGLHQSATLAINQKVRELRQGGRTVYNLGLGESPFPVPEPVVQRLREFAPRKEYLPVQGLEELREAVAEYLRQKRGMETHASRVLVGPGSKELLFLLQLCFYGDLIVPSPCWVSYTPQAQIVGRKVTTIPTEAAQDWKVTPATLKAILEEEDDQFKPRLLVLNYPANPTGVTYNDDELQALAKVAEEFGVLVLSDEIYSGLDHDGKHSSIAKYYPEGTIILDGISKWAGAGGWRLGVFIFPEQLQWLQKAMAAVASETYTSVCTPVQFAATKAFEGGLEIERYLQHARRCLARLSGDCVDILQTNGVNIVAPHGAFYMFPDFAPYADTLADRDIATGTQLVTRLLDETGVAMLPGSSFNRPKNELTARMSLVDFDGARAIALSEETAIDEPLPDDYSRLVCRPVVEAMEVLTDWLKA